MRLPSPRHLPATIAAIALCLTAPAASAQVFETVGPRALGMGGAFVAVADDATATYWNPAGLATGAIFSACLSRVSAEAVPPAGTGDAARGESESSVGFCLGLPSLGLSYNRLRATVVVGGPGSTETGGGGRQDLRTHGVGVSSLVTHQVGVTFVQSLTAALVAGVTVKYIRGIAATGTGASDLAGKALDEASDLVGRGSNSVDLDLGVMATAGAFRAGLVVRNLRGPGFTAPSGDTLSLTRQVRVGVAFAPSGDIASYVSDPRGLVLAVDADLTRTPTPAGDRRMVAGGVERWFLDRHLGLRAGARVNTAGAARAVATAGVSYAVRPAMFVEGHAAAGGSDADRGWSVGLRVGF